MTYGKKKKNPFILHASKGGNLYREEDTAESKYTQV